MLSLILSSLPSVGFGMQGQWEAPATNGAEPDRATARRFGRLRLAAPALVLSSKRVSRLEHPYGVMVVGAIAGELRIFD